jgi:hypothetical protein
MSLAFVALAAVRHHIPGASALPVGRAVVAEPVRH